MLRSESYKKGIIKSTALNVIVKCISFINTLLIAYYFGITIETDIYFYIYSTVILITSFINGMDLSVIIPEGMQLEQKEGKKAAILFYNSFAYLYLVIGILLFILLFFFSVSVYSNISSFNKSVLSEHRYLLIVSSALPLFLILSNYLTSVLTTLKYFTAPLLANGIAYFFALIALVIFHKSAGISSVLTGLVAGYILNVILLLVFMYIKLQWRFSFAFNILSKRIKKNLLSVQLGNLAGFAFNYGIIVLLSGLATGVYSAYNYSMQIVNIPIIFIVSQIASVAGIKFNELAAKNLHTELNRIFQDSVGVLLFLIIPFCFITCLYADTIVNFLFVRGDATKSAEKIILFLKYLIFLVPFLAINTFISRIMTADKKVSQAFYFQLVFNTTVLLLLMIFTKYFNEEGFIFTMLLSYFLYITIASVFLFRWLMPFICYLSVLRSFGIILLYNAPLAFICYKLFYGEQTIISLIGISCSYYLILITINHFIKINNSMHFHLSGILKLIALKIR